MITNNIETKSIDEIVDEIYESIKSKSDNQFYKGKMCKKIIAFLYLYGKFHLDIIRNNKNISIEDK